jgi:predicted AlkP superfamily phosphohydrolase/phosphomutase
MHRRVVMLGLDGVDRMLVQQWIAEGRLPVMKELFAESHKLLLDEANRPLPGGVWTDIATGASAAHHGYIHQQALRIGSYEWRYVDSSHVAIEPFYATLSKNGIRCALVDWPVSHPIDDFNGVQVIDWGTEFQLWHFETRPKGFATKLYSTYGKHPFTDYAGTDMALSNLVALKHELRRGIEMKRDVALDLLASKDYDFIYVCFSELHKGGHFLWRFHDRKHPEYTEAEPALVNSLLECYEHLDRALGTILAQLKGTDDLVVVADRGMIANHRGDHLVDDALIKLDLATPRGKIAAPSRFRSLRARLLGGKRAKRAYHYIAYELLPDAVRESLLPLHRAAIGSQPPFDWNRTRVFRLPTVGDSYLRVNLKGREPTGTVAPGAEYEATLREVAARFLALVNPETGERVVENVYFPAKHFAGPRSAELPDIALIWNSNAPINGVASDDVGVIAGRQAPDRSGNHRSEGFALFRGASFAAGASEQEGDGRQIAPLILQRFGVDPPAHYELSAPGTIVGQPRNIRAA